MQIWNHHGVLFMGSPAPAVCSRQICWPINVIINGWRRWKCRKWRGVRITMMTHVWEINFPVSAIRVTACHNTDTSYTDIRCFITLLKQYLWCVPSVYIEQGASLSFELGMEQEGFKKCWTNSQRLTKVPENVYYLHIILRLLFNDNVVSTSMKNPLNNPINWT